MGLAGDASVWSAVRSFTTKSPDPTLSVNDISVVEGNTGTKTAQVTVTRSDPTSGTSSVRVGTSNGTATAPSDYTQFPPTPLTFSPGETAKTVDVTIAGDTAVEPDETFSLKLSSPTGAVITDDTGNVTITNDDVAAAQPTLAINDVSLTEGDYGMQNAQFTVSRAGPPTGTSTVRYQTRNGSADAGSDYGAVAATTLTLFPGETSKTVSVMVNGDTVVEGHETFKVELSSPTGATIADNSGTATIRNNDASLSINDIEVDEGDSNPRTGTFTVTRTGATEGTSSAMYATVNGSATAPSDYTALYGSMLVFSPGETSKTISVTIAGDRIDESNETFRVTLSNPSGATISDGSGTVEIDDND